MISDEACGCTQFLLFDVQYFYHPVLFYAPPRSTLRVNQRQPPTTESVTRADQSTIDQKQCQQAEAAGVCVRV